MTASVLSVRCLYCGAEVDAPCINKKTGNPIHGGEVHPMRRHAVETSEGKEEWWQR